MNPKHARRMKTFLTTGIDAYDLDLNSLETLETLKCIIRTLELRTRKHTNFTVLGKSVFFIPVAELKRLDKRPPLEWRSVLPVALGARRDSWHDDMSPEA